MDFKENPQDIKPPYRYINTLGTRKAVSRLSFLFAKKKKGVKIMGRPRKIKTAKSLELMWEDYKNHCDNKTVLAHDFSSKNSEFVSAELRKSITYTIEGFCVFISIPRSIFYSTYAEDERYSDIVTRIREECEVDAREKFELGVIPSQLANLWMGKYGYSAKMDTNVSTKDIEKSKLDELIRQMKED